MTTTTHPHHAHGIGATETLHMFISNRPGRSRPGTTGEVIPGYEARVVDEKEFQPVPDGQPGLLAVRGPTGSRWIATPAITSRTPAMSLTLGICVSTTRPTIVAVAGSSETISA